MKLPLIIRRSLRQHLLSTTITALSIALAGGLLMSVWVVKVQSQATFTQVNTGSMQYSAPGARNCSSSSTRFFTSKRLLETSRPRTTNLSSVGDVCEDGSVAALYTLDCTTAERSILPGGSSFR
ncbi:MAG TPA: hypothetical protein VHE61_07725 [Opitutaceae bacterium]|nr:hypothetical protein [Opitutaceae bacterium]